MPKDKLWNRYFILVCLTPLLTGLCMNMLNSILAPFANGMWDSKSLGGLLTTFFNIGSIVMAFFCGPLVDRHGRRNMYVIGAILCGAPTVFCALFPTPAVCLTARLIQGIAKGITTVAAASIVAEVVPASRLGEAMGYYGIGTSISMAFGPMLGLLLSSGGAYSRMFFACAALYGAAAAMGFGITYEKEPAYQEIIALRKHPGQGAEGDSPGAYTGIWKLIERKALLASLNYTICFGSYSCVLVFITVYSQEILGFGAGAISAFYFLTAATMLLIRTTCGWIFDRKGALWIIVPTHLALIFMLLLLASRPDTLAMYLLTGALYGAGMGLAMPSYNALCVVDSPRERSAQANATFYFMMDFGILIASACFGVLIDSYADPADGYRMMFLISVGVCLVSLVMSCLCFNEEARRKRREN